MARCRALFALLLMACAVIGFATDYRLVIASDDPNTRQAPSLVVFEGTGKLTKDDRITSITFSAGADIKPNSLVSLDGSSGKAALALSPDVEVYKGKVMIAGAKPTRKVIPAYLSIDTPASAAAPSGNKFSSLVQPIIHQVYSLPWGFICGAVGLVLTAMFLMNRRSQAFTTTMSKEAKSLYLETVNSIVDRLDKIEASQHNLVKNPPVARAFRAQIEGFEARLNKIERLAKDVVDGLGKVTFDFVRESEKQATAANAKFDAFQGDLMREVEKLQTDLAQFSKMQLAVREELGLIPSQISAKSEALMSELAQVHAEVADLMKAQPAVLEDLGALKASAEEQERLFQAHMTATSERANRAQEAEAKVMGEICALRAEMDVAQANLAALQTMPAQLEAVSASLPREFESMREAMPSLSHVEARLEKLDSIEDQLASMPDLQSSLEALPSRFDGLGSEIDRIHDTILHQIEGLSGKLDHSREDLSELLSAHNFEAAAPAPVEEVQEDLSNEVEALEEELAPEVEAEAEGPREDEPVLDEQPSEELVPEEVMPEEAVTEEPAPMESELVEEVAEEEPVTEEPAQEEPLAEEIAWEEPAPEEEEAAAVEEAEEPAMEAMPEFHFSHAIDQLVSAPVEEAEPHAEAELPTTFKLEPLPDHLDTFEDGEDTERLTAFHEEDLSEEEPEHVADVLVELFASHAPVEEPDAEPEEPQSAHAGHWLGSGGSSARTWSSTSSRPMNLVPFDNEIKPMTPIGTAPIGETIGSAIYAFGRVVYSCGNVVCSFWPGREDRVLNLDHTLPSGEWRLAAKGPNLYVAEKNRVKIVSLQGWFTLEQFNGEYLDMVLTDDRWVGLRDADGAVLDFRDHRGQVLGSDVQLNAPVEGLLFSAEGKRCFAATADGRVLEVSEHGYEELGQGPEGYRLAHLCAYQGSPLALFSNGEEMQCVHFAGANKSCTLSLAEFGGVPVLMGGKLYLADLRHSELVTVNLKKMSVSSMPAFEGVSEIRRMIGVQHGSHQSLFVVAGGRLATIDPKNGKEVKLCAANQAKIDLIGADHHLVLASSCQYQNVIRVLEPFVERVAA